MIQSLHHISHYFVVSAKMVIPFGFIYSDEGMPVYFICAGKGTDADSGTIDVFGFKLNRVVVLIIAAGILAQLVLLAILIYVYRDTG